MKEVLRKVLLATAAFCLLAAPAVQAENLKIGAIFAVTGGASFLGGPEARSAEMVVEEINKEKKFAAHPYNAIHGFPD